MPDTDTPDFGMPATVLWSTELPPTGYASRGTNRKFARLDEAVVFVVEEIPDELQLSVMILTDGPSYRPENIKDLYALISRRTQ